MTSPSTSQFSQKDIPTFKPKISTNSTYAAVAQKDAFPKRDQGLIMDVVEGLNLTDYTIAIGDLVQPKNVLFASRISKNRISLFLSSKELVENITDKYSSIIIQQKTVSIRPLINKLKRVIFSNVSPTIPNTVLEEVLDQLEIHRGSPISILKASIAKDLYSHVSSHRRQVYVKPDDVHKIPELFKIEHNGLIYYIYSSTDILKCFLCNVEGHVAKNCTNVDEMSNNSLSYSLPTPRIITNTINNTPVAKSNSQVNSPNVNNTAMEFITGDIKRIHS